MAVIHHTHTHTPWTWGLKEGEGECGNPLWWLVKWTAMAASPSTAKWTKQPRTICFTQLMSRLVTAPSKLNASSPALLTSSACSQLMSRLVTAPSKLNASSPALLTSSASFAKSGLLCSLHRKLPCQLYLRKKSTQSTGFDFCHGEISVTVWRSKHVSG